MIVGFFCCCWGVCVCVISFSKIPCSALNYITHTMQAVVKRKTEKVTTAAVTVSTGSVKEDKWI